MNVVSHYRAVYRYKGVDPLSWHAALINDPGFWIRGAIIEEHMIVGSDDDDAYNMTVYLISGARTQGALARSTAKNFVVL